MLNGKQIKGSLKILLANVTFKALEDVPTLNNLFNSV